jgi:hypothetical protein
MMVAPELFGIERGEMAEPRADPSALHGMIERLLELVNHDAALVRRGRYLDLDILIEIGAVPYYASIAGGRIARLDRGPLLMRSWALAFRAPDDAWRQFWQPLPPPHFHDIFALAKRGQFRIEGEIHPLMANLLYFKDLLAAPRRLAGGVR